MKNTKIFFLERPRMSSLGQELLCGLRTGTVAGIILGIIMLIILVVKAPHYFISIYRTFVIPLYLIGYTSLLFSLTGAFLGLLTWVIGLFFAPVARLNYSRLNRAIMFSLVPGWIMAQYITWVLFRGRIDTLVLITNAGILVCTFVVAIIIYRYLDGINVRMPESRGWFGWLSYIYIVLVLGSFILVWVRSPSTSIPVYDLSKIEAGKISSNIFEGTPASIRRNVFEPVNHIILITIDTLRADRLGCYGYELNTTPNLDSLAAESIRFDKMYALSSGTVPTFFSIFSGTDPAFVGGKNQLSVLSEDVETFVEQLKRAGYKTVATVCQSLLTPQQGFAQGFDLYTNLPARNKNPDLVTDDAIRKLDQAQGFERTFFWFHYFNTHGPYNPPLDLVKMFNHRTGNDPHFVPKYDYSALYGINKNVIGHQYQGHIKDGWISTIFLNELYDAEVRDMDDAVGRLLNHIRKLGIWGDAVIIVTADHGESLGEHGIYGRHSVGLHDPQVRIPLIIKMPKRISRHPIVVDALVDSSDISPTILSTAGLKSRSQITGRSLVPFLTSGSVNLPDHRIIMQTSFPEGMTYLLNSSSADYPDWALVEGDHKYIFYANNAFDRIRSPLNYINAWRELLYGHIRSDELYRLGEDDNPANNLIKQHPDLALSMKRALLSSPQIWFFHKNMQPEVESSELMEEQLKSLGYIQ